MRKVTFDRERCKGCRLCLPVCPVKIIRMSESLNRAGYYPAEVSDDALEECISCGLCATICPDMAIEVRRPEKTGARAGEGEEKDG